ncbi:7-cyano-7-deazaguanine synthase QueC [Kribbella sp. CA-293567]|uniref:7-cyano-7-deazaguanine synthase QueC n=1 Tax=Kribbella sp. CA-293567 TaxID=3002436 RepID=UPI0022DD72F0|nr:7-cyano-7-deazaguanine synthase QueC [Kribbella sp. CA-293567]WBQ07617.1 7-cyano-7-deazaguanine synthase QueC [Kribbella sp. CA-293567]
MEKAGNTAVVLLSGGLDSTTVLAIAADAGHDLHTISFDYGQRHVEELRMAAQAAAEYGAVRHNVVKLDRGLLGGSALTDPSIPVPHRNRPAPIDLDAAVTYVPARNTVFLAMALAYAESVGCTDIYLGVSSADGNSYPDCRPAYIEAFEQMANLGTRTDSRPIRILAPLLHLTKAETVRRGLALGVDYSETLSCFDPQHTAPCGTCDACLLRRHAFATVGVQDPAVHRVVRGH